ncbi:TAXI family TRAP transporter solute-binding subunit [Magnetovibrio sp.]|uniref:TAXI family TRAP transporter solute-binding subunit n=1 Tax=Magnetovibrio sp. TaxID=2024836 RepID=UPI002F94EE99
MMRLKSSLKSMLSGALTVALTIFGASTQADAGQGGISVGTGGVTGVYYPAGSSICKLVNDARAEHALRCFTESTAGSVYNIRTIRDGGLDLGIAQSDWVYHAYHGTSKFKQDGPFENLRVVLTLHSEPFTLVVRPGLGIKGFADLKGKRVNIGNPGSGQRGTMEVVMAAFGMTAADFSETTELDAAHMSHAFCDNQFDAMVYTVGHPAAAISEVASSCDAELVNVTGPQIDNLVSENPYYRHAVIPGGLYEGTSGDVASFGVQGILVTSADTPDYKVYTVAKQVLAHIDDFRRLHDSFAILKLENMIQSRLAPTHPGALKAFQEMELTK